MPPRVSIRAVKVGLAIGSRSQHACTIRVRVRVSVRVRVRVRVSSQHACTIRVRVRVSVRVRVRVRVSSQHACTAARISAGVPSGRAGRVSSSPTATAA